jgi:hypothetical protein
MRLVWCIFFSPLSSDRVKEPCQPLFFRGLIKIPMAWLCQELGLFAAHLIQGLGSGNSKLSQSLSKKTPVSASQAHRNTFYMTHTMKLEILTLTRRNPSFCRRDSK